MKKLKPVFDDESRMLTNLSYKPGEVCKASVCHLIDVVDQGLIGNTVGDPQPGEMCVEAAVAYSLGLPFNDKPSCVNGPLSSFKISINDNWPWATHKNRALGLRRLAVAQLGTNTKGFKFKAFEAQTLAKWKERITNVPLIYGLAKGWQQKFNAALKTKDPHKIAAVLCKETTYGESVLTWQLRIAEEEVGFEPDEGADNHLNEDIMQQLMADCCEDAVQVLIKMKTPGSRFLYLTKKPAKKLASKR